MEITSKPPEALAPSLAAAQTANIGEEFNSFIQLLTAQVRNQDPLAPLDSTQFVEQLATFSALEQQVTSNQHLDSIASVLAEIQLLTASEWVGHEIAVPVEWAPWNSGEMTFRLPDGEGAEAGLFMVQDQTGRTVYTGELSAGQSEFVWAGTLDEGSAVAGEVYRFQITTPDATDSAIQYPELVTRVNALDLSGGSLRLITDAGFSIDATDARHL